MSSIVCRGLQQCFEPLPFEPCVLRHKFNQPNLTTRSKSPLLSQHQKEHQENYSNQEEETQNKTLKNDCDHVNNNGEMGGWSFIQSLSKMSRKSIENESEKVYVHPIAKPSSAKLSLEMCTESLGSETGCYISEPTDEFSSLSLKSCEESHEYRQSKSRIFNKKPAGIRKFPPPLTTISGSENVQVRPHREDGRLVLEAVNVSSCNGYFRAERADGRLRLCLVKDNECFFDDNDDDDDGDEEEEVEDIGGNSENVGCEMGIGERERPSRCKEGERGNKVLPNWEAICVAIS